MSDRSFKQFDLTVKDYFNTLARLLVSEFKEKGAIPKDAGRASFGNYPGLGEKMLKEELDK
jgi:hypothetical protein